MNSVLKNWIEIFVFKKFRIKRVAAENKSFFIFGLSKYILTRLF